MPFTSSARQWVIGDPFLVDEMHESGRLIHGWRPV
jgi:hypothetical protein